ncbi:MAG: tetratricopeptide repeat protein [Singulisphaera sp.]
MKRRNRVPASQPARQEGTVVVFGRLRGRFVRLLLGTAILFAAVGLTYRDVLDAPFMFDDLATIVHNDSIRQLWPLVNFSGAATPLMPSPGTPVSGRPLVNLSLAVNYHFAALAPRSYRATNVVLHVLVAIALWVVLQRTLRLDFFAEKFRQAAEPLAFVAALAWSLHPLTTECVAYVTQRTEVMMVLCYLLVVYLAQRYWAATNSRERAVWLSLAVVACQLGMFAKESMATAPAVVLLYERTFIAGTFARALRTSWRLYLGLALTWLPLAALNLAGPRTPVVGFQYGVTAIEWWLTQAKVVFLYLKLAVWPWPLVIHYEMPYFRTIAAALPWLSALFLFVSAVVFLIVRRRSAGFVGAWLLVLLSPTFVVPIATEVAAERRMYLPLTALISWSVVGCYALASRSLTVARTARGRTTMSPLGVTIAGALLLTACYAWLDVRRLAAYADEVTLWSDAELHQPDNSVVQINLGDALEKAGRRPEAIAHYERAIEISPNYLAHQSLAGALAAVGRLDEAQIHYEEAARQQPNLAIVHFNLARIAQQRGDKARARSEYEAALGLLDDYRIHYALGELLESEGDARAARQNYEQALRGRPEFLAAHRRLGLLLVGAGDAKTAITHLEVVLRREPSCQAYANLAAAYAQAGDSQKALQLADVGAQLARRSNQPAEAQQLEAWADNLRKSESIRAQAR